MLSILKVDFTHRSPAQDGVFLDHPARQAQVVELQPYLHVLKNAFSDVMRGLLKNIRVVETFGLIVKGESCPVAVDGGGRWRQARRAAGHHLPSTATVR